VHGRHVLIVSESPETLDGVQDYLSRFGARVSAVTRTEEALRAVTSSDALLLFADDYPSAAVCAVLTAAARQLCVVVTEDVEAMRSRVSGAEKQVFLRRPVWGWMLLDALRAEPSDNHV